MKTVQDYIDRINSIAECSIELDFICDELHKNYGDDVPRNATITIMVARDYLNDYNDMLKNTVVKGVK